MDSIRIITQPVIPPAPSLSGSAVVSQPAPAVASGVTDQVDLHAQAQAAAQAAAQPKAQAIANPHVLGDGTFAMFTVGGRLYTRFTTVNNGIINVTYVPEQPGISSLGSGGLDIQA